MGFFDFFKKQNKKPINIERIAFPSIDSWLSDKTAKTEKERQIFFKNIKERALQLADELKIGINSLENLNWSKIKEQEKILTIVKENLNNYISHLDDLKSGLENLEEKEDILEKINSIFQIFERKAANNYQKATILIGKEISSVTDNIRNFSKDVEKIHQGKKDMLIEIRILQETKEKLAGFQNLEKILNNSKKDIDNLKKEINDLEHEIKNTQGRINEIKISNQFNSYLQRTDDLQSLNDSLEKEIFRLKSLIDFRVLAKIYHSNKKKMEIMKEYKENFSKAFQQDSLGIIGLMEEAGINTEQAANLALKINILEKEINQIEKNLEKNPALELEERIVKNAAKIDNLKNTLIKEEKKLGKFQAQKDSSFNEIKSLVKTLNLEII